MAVTFADLVRNMPVLAAAPPRSRTPLQMCESPDVTQLIRTKAHECGVLANATFPDVRRVSSEDKVTFMCTQCPEWLDAAKLLPANANDCLVEEGTAITGKLMKDMVTFCSTSPLPTMRPAIVGRNTTIPTRTNNNRTGIPGVLPVSTSSSGGSLRQSSSQKGDSSSSTPVPTTEKQSLASTKSMVTLMVVVVCSSVVLLF